jgi:hypothetical protein
MSAVDDTAAAYVFSEAVQTLKSDGVKFGVLLLVTKCHTEHEKSSRRTFSELP